MLAAEIAEMESVIQDISSLLTQCDFDSGKTHGTTPLPFVVFICYSFLKRVVMTWTTERVWEGWVGFRSSI